MSEAEQSNHDVLKHEPHSKMQADTRILESRENQFRSSKNSIALNVPLTSGRMSFSGSASGVSVC